MLVHKLGRSIDNMSSLNFFITSAKFQKLKLRVFTFSFAFGEITFAKKSKRT